MNLWCNGEKSVKVKKHKLIRASGPVPHQLTDDWLMQVTMSLLQHNYIDQ